MTGSKFRIIQHNLRDGGERSMSHEHFDNAVCYIDERTLSKGEGALFQYEVDYDPLNPLHTVLTSPVEDIAWSEDGTLTLITKNTEYVFVRLLQ